MHSPEMAREHMGQTQESEPPLTLKEKAGVQRWLLTRANIKTPLRKLMWIQLNSEKFHEMITADANLRRLIRTNKKEAVMFLEHMLQDVPEHVSPEDIRPAEEDIPSHNTVH